MDGKTGNHQWAYHLVKKWCDWMCYWGLLYKKGCGRYGDREHWQTIKKSIGKLWQLLKMRNKSLNSKRNGRDSSNYSNADWLYKYFWEILVKLFYVNDFNQGMVFGQGSFVMSKKNKSKLTEGATFFRTETTGMGSVLKFLKSASMSKLSKKSLFFSFCSLGTAKQSLV